MTSIPFKTFTFTFNMLIPAIRGYEILLYVLRCKAMPASVAGIHSKCLIFKGSLTLAKSQNLHKARSSDDVDEDTQAIMFSLASSPGWPLATAFPEYLITSLIKTLTKISDVASESIRNDKVSVLKVRVNILRRINGHISVTIKCFFKFKYSHVFDTHSYITIHTLKFFSMFDYHGDFML